MKGREVGEDFVESVALQPRNTKDCRWCLHHLERHDITRVLDDHDDLEWPCKDCDCSHWDAA